MGRAWVALAEGSPDKCRIPSTDSDRRHQNQQIVRFTGKCQNDYL